MFSCKKCLFVSDGAVQFSLTQQDDDISWVGERGTVIIVPSEHCVQTGDTKWNTKVTESEMHFNTHNVSVCVRVMMLASGYSVHSVHYFAVDPHCQ